MPLPPAGDAVGDGYEHMGAAIRAHRIRRGFTQRELAELAGLSVRWLRNVEAGRTSPRLAQLQALSRILGVDLVNRRDFLRASGGVLGAGLLATPLTDPERALSAFGGAGRVDAQLLRDLEALGADLAFRHRTVAPASIVPDLLAHVGRLRQLLPLTPPALVPQLQRLTAEGMITAGWLSFYLEDRGSAASWWEQALEHADALGTGELRAHVLVAASSLYSSQGWRPENGQGARERLAAAREAAGLGAPPRLRAWIHGRQAEEWAAIGQEVKARRELDAAARALSQARSLEGLYAGARDRRHLDAYAGNVAVLLNRPGDAVPALQRVLAETPDGYLTARAWSLLDLTEARAQLENVEGAAGALAEAQRLIRAGRLYGYGYRAQAIRRLRLDRWASSPHVQALNAKPLW